MANVERQKAEPTAAAARARPSSPSGCAIRWYATGATTTGEATAWPSTVVSVDADSIPQSTRWRRRHSANAATFPRSVRSRPGPAGEELGPVGIHSRERERLDIRERERRLHRAIISGTGTI